MVADNGHLDPAAPAPVAAESAFAPSPPHPASASPLPPLPDDQHAILAAYLKCDADLFRIAEAVGRALPDVIQALSTAPLRDYIAHATAHADEADRRLAAATLRETIRTTDSAVERRRAASALGRIVQVTRAANAADRRSAVADRRSAVADRRSAIAERAALLRALRAARADRRPLEADPEEDDADDDDFVFMEPPDAPPIGGQHAPAGPQHDPHDAGPGTHHDAHPAPPPPTEPLRARGHHTPGESVAAFLLNLRAGERFDLPEVIRRTDPSTSIRTDEVSHQRFATELATALPLLERGPWRTEPPRIEGDAAAVRTIFTRDDGAEITATFHLVKAQKHDPPAWWFVDGITLDSS